MLVGTGANATSEAIFLTQAAEKAGVTACREVESYYNKPTQEGLFQHFKAIAMLMKLPTAVLQHSGPLRDRDSRGHGETAGA